MRHKYMRKNRTKRRRPKRSKTKRRKQSAGTMNSITLMIFAHGLEPLPSESPLYNTNDVIVRKISFASENTCVFVRPNLLPKIYESARTIFIQNDGKTSKQKMLQFIPKCKELYNKQSLNDVPENERREDPIDFMNAVQSVKRDMTCIYQEPIQTNNEYELENNKNDNVYIIHDSTQRFNPAIQSVRLFDWIHLHHDFISATLKKLIKRVVVGRTENKAVDFTFMELVEALKSSDYKIINLIDVSCREVYRGTKRESELIDYDNRTLRLNLRNQKKMALEVHDPELKS